MGSSEGSADFSISDLISSADDSGSGGSRGSPVPGPSRGPPRGPGGPGVRPGSPRGPGAPGGSGVRPGSPRGRPESPVDPTQHYVYGPENYNFGGKHETMTSVFTQKIGEYESLMASTNIVQLRQFISKNYSKIVWCQYLERQLEDLINQFGTADQKIRVMKNNKNADSMIKALRELLEHAQRKEAMMDYSFDTSGTLEGSALNAVVEKSKQKMSEVLTEMQEKIRNQQIEIGILQGANMEMKVLELQLDAATQYIKQLREKDEFAVQDPSTNQSFVNDLQFKLQSTEQMSSTLRDDLENERKTKEDLMEKYYQLEAMRVKEHQDRMQEIAEAVKDLELDEGIRRGIMEKIKSLTANEKEVEKAVNEWLTATHAVIRPKKNEIMDVKNEIKSLDDELTKLRRHVAEQREVENEMRAELKRSQDATEELEEQIQEQYETCEALRSEAKASFGEHRKYMSDHRLNLPGRDLEFIHEQPIGPSTLKHLKLTAEKDKRRKLIGVPLTRQKYDRLTPGMQKRLKRDKIPLQVPLHLIPRPSKRANVSANALSPPHSLDKRFAAWKRAQGVPPENFQTPPSARIPSVIVTPPSPTTTRVPSTNFGEVAQYGSPQPGPSHRPDSPLNIGRTDEVTPEQFKTPLISHTRFGYTDPACKVLNVPPGPFQRGTPFRQTVVLTSPQREEPLLVDIGVDPKPLTETESGEHFICDISLNVQPGLQDQQIDQQGMSPDFTHGLPPDVSPTTAQRRGYFSPRGIFKRGHYNVRKVFSQDEYQDHDASSQERSPSPVIKGPYYGRQFSGPDSSSERTVIQGPSYGYQSSTPDTDGSWGMENYPDRYMEEGFYRRRPPPLETPRGVYADRHRAVKRLFQPGEYISPDLPWSPNVNPDALSPIKGFPPSPPIYSDRSLSFEFPEGDRSNQPVNKGVMSPFYQKMMQRFQPPASYSSPERSPSPMIKGPSRRYQSSTPDSSLERSAPAVIQGPSHRYYTPESSSDRSAPAVIQGPSYRSSTLDSTSERDSPKSIQRDRFYRRRAPRQDITSGSTPSPVPRRTFGKGPPSPVGSPLHRSPPSGYGPDLDSSSSPYSAQKPSSPYSAQGSLSPYSAQGSSSPYSAQGSSSPYSAQQEDSLNRRWQPSEFQPGVEFQDRSGSTSPEMGSSPYRYPFNESYGSDSLDSENGYLDGSLNKTGLFDESVFNR